MYLKIFKKSLIMKGLFFLAALCATTLFIACEQTEVITNNSIEAINLEDRAEATTYTLFAGQDIDAGTVTIETTDENLVVTYQTNEGWSLGTTHLYAGTLEGLPTTGAGNPKHGQFPYAQEAEDGQLTNMVVYTIPLSEVELTDGDGDSGAASCIYLAAHAELHKSSSDEESEGDAEETGYAAWDIEFDGNRWGGLVEYCF